MDFVLRKHKRLRIFDISTQTLDAKILKEIIEFVKRNLKHCDRLALNCKELSNLKDAKTVAMLCDNNISLYNLNPMLNTQLSLLSQKKFPLLYLSEEDFINNKRILARRRFKLV